MKPIGRAGNGDFLIQMSENEFKEFSSLSLAVEGVEPTYNIIRDLSYKDTIDLSDVFSIIREWYTLNFKINEIKNRIALLQDELYGFESDEKRGANGKKEKN